MTDLKEKIIGKQSAIESITSSVPKGIIWRNMSLFNNFDNYGKNDDPETEWSNWVNWDQATIIFDNSSDDD